jgi:iron uptake system component EfeO
MKNQINSGRKWAHFSAIALLIALATTACSNSTNSNQPTAAGNTETTEIEVTVTDQGCQPAQITVAAGNNTFVINNKSSEVIEWEILSGVKVIAERENIAPNFVQKLKENLEPGEYEMVCGEDDKPHGKLTVTAAGNDTSNAGS